MDRMNTIATERLLLRSFTQEDAKGVYAYASDEETTTYLTFYPHKNIEESQFVIESLYMQNPLCYCIAVPKTNTCIGCFELRRDNNNDKASFGYVLNKTYWNRGFMTEILKVMIPFVFDTLRLHRIESTCYEGNESSGHVMKKCGMKYEGFSKDAVKVKNRFFSVHRYGLTIDEYQFRKK